MCNILTWPTGGNTVDVVDRYIDKIGGIIRMSSYPQVLCIGGCWWQLHLAEDNINKVIIEISQYPQVLCISRCWWQLHPAEDNTNEVITGMSPYPQVLCISGCWWQLHPAKDNINKVIIRISSWPMDMVELCNGGRCIRPQKWAWASSQQGTNNIINGKQRSETWV